MEKLIKTPFEIAGLSVGMGLFGEALDSEGLKKGGEAAGKFIPIAVNVSMAGNLINQLKNIGGKNNVRKVQEKEKEKVRVKLFG